MIRAVIFDMDGLMFDTERLWVEEGKRLSKKLGYEIPDELFFKTIGMKNEDASILFNKTLGYDFPFLSFRKIYHRCIDQKLQFEKIKEHTVKGYENIENKFVERYLTKDGETVDEAKIRLKQEQQKREK